MTLEDVKRNLEHIRAVAQDLGDVERAVNLERELYIRAIEACIQHTINIPTLKEVMKAQSIQMTINSNEEL